MSIVIIQGPHHVDPESRAISLLRSKAGNAGRQLLVRTGATLQELIECLRQSAAADTEFVLLDSGQLDPRECDRKRGELCRVLDEMPAPYIEVHDSSAQVLDLHIHPQHAPLVTVVVNDDRQTGYSLACAIALRHLHASAASPCHTLVA